MRLRPAETVSLTSLRGRAVGAGAASAAWGGVGANMHWGRFMDKVKALPWAVPEHVQLLVNDDEGTYFWLYMFRDGALRNFAPLPPEEDGIGRPW